MLDRRLNQDDGRGLGESITDNKRTSIPLWLIIEPISKSVLSPFLSPALSPAASLLWRERNYPLHCILILPPSLASVSFFFLKLQHFL